MIFVELNLLLHRQVAININEKLSFRLRLPQKRKKTFYTTEVCDATKIATQKTLEQDNPDVFIMRTRHM